MDMLKGTGKEDKMNSSLRNILKEISECVDWNYDGAEDEALNLAITKIRELFQTEDCCAKDCVPYAKLQAELAENEKYAHDKLFEKIGEINKLRDELAELRKKKSLGA
jgi:hypothetical protein